MKDYYVETGSTPATQRSAQQLAELQQRLARSEETVALLRAQRGVDLERLTQMNQTRDALEGRAATQLELVAKAQGERKKAEERIDALEERLANRQPDSSKDGPVKVLQPPSGPINKPWQIQRFSAYWMKRTEALAGAAHASGDLAAAEVLFNAALLFNDSSSLLTRLAHVLREQEQFTKAERIYERALLGDPENAENIFLTGFCAENTGRSELAAQRYELALAKNPQLINKYDQLQDFNTRLFS